MLVIIRNIADIILLYMVLGEKVNYPDRYSPSILVAIPRIENRKTYNVKANEFSGFDVWHVYEFSFLTHKGLPVIGVLKMVIPSNSEFLVESKSLKLYLNSFNMMKFGDSREEGIFEILQIIKDDLEKLLQCKVELNLFQNSAASPFDFNEYEVIETSKKAENIEFTDFTENPELLAPHTKSPSEFKISSNLLRSNCKVTHQPDWGSVFVHIKTSFEFSKYNFLKYLVSLRNENHFHEEICELIYHRLNHFYRPELLMVCCIYTRRGGIDICPVRFSSMELCPPLLTDYRIISQKLFRQ